MIIISLKFRYVHDIALTGTQITSLHALNIIFVWLTLVQLRCSKINYKKPSLSIQSKSLIPIPWKPQTTYPPLSIRNIQLISDPDGFPTLHSSSTVREFDSPRSCNYQCCVRQRGISRATVFILIFLRGEGGGLLCRLRRDILDDNGICILCVRQD